MTYPSPVKYVLLGKETTWNTSVTADKDPGLVISDVSTPLSQEVIESKGIGSIETQTVNSGLIDTQVDVSGDFQSGRLMEYLIGSVAHAETTGDWKHTFSVDNNPPSATFEVGNNLSTDTVLTLPGMIAESGELSVSLNENVKLSATFKGSGTVTPSDSASSYSIDALPTFPHALCTVTINGVQADEVQSFSISINKVVERAGGVGSNVYQQGHAVDIGFEYSASLGFSSKVYHDLFANNTTHEVIFNASNGVTLGSGRRELNITLENCKLSGDTESTSIGGLTFIDLTGVGTLKADECFSVDDISDSNW